MLDIEKMKAAALAAKDKWSFEPSYADFIATANPSAVLELIARLEAAEKENAALIAELKAENERLKALNVELTAKCNWYNSDGARLERERDELTRQLAELVTAIDEHLVVAHIGVFNQGDDPKAALNKIACYEQGVGDYFGKEALRKELAEANDDYKTVDALYREASDYGQAQHMELLEVRGQLAEYKGLLSNLMEVVEEPPEHNCSCHISPPCGDCVEWSGLREALSEARTAMKGAPE